MCAGCLEVVGRLSVGWGRLSVGWGDSLEGVWRMSRGCVEAPTEFGEVFWEVCGGYLQVWGGCLDVWGGCLQGISRLSEGVRGLTGGYGEAIWKGVVRVPGECEKAVRRV